MWYLRPFPIDPSETTLMLAVMLADPRVFRSRLSVTVTVRDGQISQRVPTSDLSSASALTA